MTQPDRRHLRRARLALAVVVAAALAAWLWFPGGRTFLQQSLTALASLDPQQVRGFIAAWGPQAALVSFALMILQAIVAPLPAFLITLANAALFGAFWGGALSWFFWPFMLATGVGQLPATIVYSWAGSLLTGGTFWLATGLSLLFALAVVISIAKNIYRERHKRSSP